MRTRRIKQDKSDFMRVSGSFFTVLDRNIIRDSHERKIRMRDNPNKVYYSSFKHATSELANELRKKGW